MLKIPAPKTTALIPSNLNLSHPPPAHTAPTIPLRQLILPRLDQNDQHRTPTAPIKTDIALAYRNCAFPSLSPCSSALHRSRRSFSYSSLPTLPARHRSLSSPRCATAPATISSTFILSHCLHISHDDNADVDVNNSPFDFSSFAFPI